MAETLLERQQRLAAEQNDFQAWRLARQAENEVGRAWGGGLINGRPANVVVDSTQVDVIPPTRTGANNPAMVAREAERLRGNTQAQQEQAGLDRKSRYDAFLESQGIDPGTIGGARVTRNGLQAPTLAQQQAAQDARNQYNSERSDLRVAANQLSRRGNRAAAAELRQQADYLYPQIGGRSYEAQMDYWLNRVNPTPYGQRQGAPANGFGRPVDFDSSLLDQVRGRI